ncbi:MAG: lipoyl(octanoyl) transferase LipB [Planctomycetota bacterium]|jgi:lipoate-protein ligase B
MLIDLTVVDLGEIAYADGLARQRRAQQAVIEARGSGEGTMTLFLLEHVPPVITVSRRRGARRHLVADDEQLRTAGVGVAETDRGGDVTYHGPGQLVAYPILDLNALGLRLHGYMRRLEQIVIDTLAEFGIEGERDPAATGVWVEGSHEVTKSRSHEVTKSPSRKICAMGVRVTRWVSMHGLALNVTTNLEHFDLIVPCGLAGRTVTSMQQELGDRCPSMDEVKAALARQFQTALGLHV